METFVVRVWVPSRTEADETTGLSGFVERAGGQPVPFHGADELVALICATTHTTPRRSAAEG